MKRNKFAKVATVATVGMLMAMGTTIASAAPPAGAEPAQGPGQDHGYSDYDSRKGERAPTARQRGLAAQHKVTSTWNKLGTPARLAPSQGVVLESGLPTDPVATARAYIANNLELLGLTQRAADSLELVADNPIGQGAAVLLRQKFGDLPAGYDGLVTVGVANGKAYLVTSSLAPDVSTPAPATLSAAAAIKAAAVDVGLDPGTVTAEGAAEGWNRFSASGLGGTQLAKLVAVPLPEGGARTAYEVALVDENEASPQNYTSYVDGISGEVLIREDNVVEENDNPQWKAFPANPPIDYSSTDTRETWCWLPATGCDLTVGNSASPLAWDIDPGLSQTTSTATTRGNNEWAANAWTNSRGSGFDTSAFATQRPDRDYTAYPWTNQWNATKCSPAVFTSPERNDIDAADANLHVMHNRMHDFSYNLGFTESAWNMQVDNFGKGGKGGDPERGNAQSGARVTSSLIRNNANQSTGADGSPPTTNMYLWQSVAGSFYAPCADGDFDMSIIAHENTHAISNRMAAGPDRGLSGFQAGSMGESWSDLVAMEYLDANGLVPKGQSAFVVGQYATGNPIKGIRDYPLSDNPLNYGNVGFDLVGPEVHADGEIWNGVHYDLRQAMIKRYGAGTAALQKSCVDGTTAVNQCPGNRQWMQLVFDGWLLMAQGNVSMLDARDAMLAADQIRFDGANQDLLWNTFAKRGFGQDASTTGTGDQAPKPGFASPYAKNATISFQPIAEAAGIKDMRVFVGDYQARTRPIADTDPGTELPATATMVPGKYNFVAQAPGFGMTRFTVDVVAGSQQTVPVKLERNLASSANGATATGDGVGVANLIDDDEATNWAVLGAPAAPVAGKQVTVKLAGDGAQKIRRVQVSALLRPQDTKDPAGDTGSQNRFTALRSFKLLACTATGEVDCTTDGDFRLVYTSPGDAFPADAPRPTSPDLINRSFAIPQTEATHLRFEVVGSQCTGNAAFAGQQTADLSVPTDCVTGSAISGQVRATDFQAFAH